MKYSAFDIHLWGGFDKMMQVILLFYMSYVGSDDWSAYCIVLGGMIGS